MAGRVIRVVNRRRINLGTTPAAAAPAFEIFLATRIDISQWREIVCYVRLHAPSIITSTWTTAPKIVFYADGYTSEDPTGYPSPQNMFNNPNGANVSLPTGLNSPGSDTMILWSNLSSPCYLGGLMAISLTGQQASATTTTFDVWMSIDLSGKE